MKFILSVTLLVNFLFISLHFLPTASSSEYKEIMKTSLPMLLPMGCFFAVIVFLVSLECLRRMLWSCDNNRRLLSGILWMNLQKERRKERARQNLRQLENQQVVEVEEIIYELIDKDDVIIVPYPNIKYIDEEIVIQKYTPMETAV